MGKDGAEKETGTTKGRAKRAGSSNDAAFKRRLGTATGKGKGERIEPYAACHIDSQGRKSASSKSGRKAGGILRQLVLGNQTQLALLEEQVRQLKQTQLQLKFLCEEFTKTEAADEELE